MLQTNINDQALRDTLAAIEFRHQNTLLGDPVIAPGTDVDKIKVSAFHYRVGGQACYKAAADDVIAPLTTTSSVQYVKELVSINAAGTIALTAGAVAASQALAELPDTPADSLAIGYLEIPASFTPETTDVTVGMIKKITETIDVTYT